MISASRLAVLRRPPADSEEASEIVKNMRRLFDTFFLAELKFHCLS